MLGTGRLRDEHSYSGMDTSKTTPEAAQVCGCAELLLEGCRLQAPVPTGGLPSSALSKRDWSKRREGAIFQASAQNHIPSVLSFLPVFLCHSLNSVPSHSRALLTRGHCHPPQCLAIGYQPWACHLQPLCQAT